jgi:hypothetical protein
MSHRPHNLKFETFTEWFARIRADEIRRALKNVRQTRDVSTSPAHQPSKTKAARAQNLRKRRRRILYRRQGNNYSREKKHSTRCLKGVNNHGKSNPMRPAVAEIVGGALPPLVITVWRASTIFFVVEC